MKYTARISPMEIIYDNVEAHRVTGNQSMPNGFCGSQNEYRLRLIPDPFHTGAYTESDNYHSCAKTGSGHTRLGLSHG